MENKRIDYIHSIRGIAIFFIVATHCNLFIESDSFLGQIWSEILREWTSVFLLISGFLFQHLLPRYEAKKFYLNKFKNVIAPYIIISIPAIALYMSGIKKEHNWVDIDSLMQHSWIYIIAFFYSTGAHLGPLWFIPMLTLIFLSSGLLHFLGRDKKRLSYAALCSVIVILLTSRPVGDSNPMVSYIHFLPVYIFGMFIYDNRALLINKKNLPLILIGILVSFTLRIYTDINPNLTIIAKIFVFLALCILFLNSAKNKALKVLSWFANASFAIYFIHGYFVGFIRMKLQTITTLIPGSGSVTGVVVDILLAFLIITLITAVLYAFKKSKLNTRIIFGS
ncbi:acyltransferase [Erwiniaceae bacterium L1_54_6]|nr:acyltransferase [Erwiniaceae bacterium L1_54_6]